MEKTETELEQEQVPQQSVVEKILNWMKGEGQTDALKEMGIDVSQYTTVEAVQTLVNSYDELANVVAELIEAMSEGDEEEEPEKPEGEEEPEKPEGEEEEPEEDSFKQEVLDGLKSLAERMDAFETAKGVRKSSEATGDEPGDKHSVWSDAVPDIRHKQ